MPTQRHDLYWLCTELANLPRSAYSEILAF